MILDTEQDWFTFGIDGGSEVTRRLSSNPATYDNCRNLGVMAKWVYSKGEVR